MSENSSHEENALQVLVKTSDIISDEIRDETNPEDLQKAMDVFSAISKYDAFSLFVLAKDGIKSDLDIFEKIGLTRKQYYTRLKQLLDSNLIEKKENKSEYYHSAFGSMIYQNHLVGVVSNLKKTKELEIIDSLKKNPKFTKNDIDEFLAKIGIKDSVVGTTNLKPQIIYKNKNATTITTSYNDMVAKILEVVAMAQKEVLLISRFSNDLIINAMLRKADAGVKIRILADVNMVENYLESAEKEKIQQLQNKKERTEVVANPFYPSKINRRYVTTPYCAILIDGGTHAGIEMIDVANPRKFSMASFTSNDDALSANIKDTFESLWKISKENPPQTVSTTNPKN